MKAWIGVGIAVVTALVALLVDPAMIFGHATTALKFAFVGILLSAAGIAFLLGQSSSDINLSRQIAVWSAGFAAIAIIATNMDVLTGTSPTVDPVAKVQKPDLLKKARVKKPVSSEIYTPDTPKINRVETVMEPEPSEFNRLAGPDDSPQFINPDYDQRNRVRGERKLTPEQKEQFKRFLESQGLKYDPETAFSDP